jgi:acetamidase/formamidase
MRASRTEYLFSVNTNTPPTMTVASGEEFTVDVRDAFDGISEVPTRSRRLRRPPLAPMAEPIVVRGAKPKDVVAIDCCPLGECADTRPKRGGQQ